MARNASRLVRRQSSQSKVEDMKTIDYRAKEPVTVSIEGYEYALAERTGRSEKALRELESRVRSDTQYESDLALIRILIGEKAVSELFPDGEDENLNRLHFYAVKLLELYQDEYRQIEAERYESTLKQMDALTSRAKSVLSLAELAPASKTGKRGSSRG